MTTERLVGSNRLKIKCVICATRFVSLPVPEELAKTHQSAGPDCQEGVLRGGHDGGFVPAPQQWRWIYGALSLLMYNVSEASFRISAARRAVCTRHMILQVRKRCLAALSLGRTCRQCAPS